MPGIENDMTVERILRKTERLFTTEERINSDGVWSELAEFILNNQSGVFLFGSSSATVVTFGAEGGLGVAAKGAKRTNRVFDSTAIQANQDLASSFQGTITNPATQWSKIKYRKPSLQNNEDAVSWLEQVNRVIHTAFSESNFDTEQAKFYQAYTCFGNAAILHEFDEEPESPGIFKQFRFTTIHLSQLAWEENAFGLVDTIYRKFMMTGRQMIEKWGEENVDQNVLSKAKDSPTHEFGIIHCIFPRQPEEVELNEVGLAPGSKRPIASVYIDVTHKTVLEESGYYEMPVFVGRWSLAPGEVYGRGPGHYAIPDIRTLNRLKMKGLEAIDLQVRPPILANERDVFGDLDLRPGGFNIVKDINGFTQFVDRGRMDTFQFSVEDLRNSIRSIYFLDKLLLPPRTETGEMTAFEISQRVEQMQRVLGPTLSRLNHEVLSPLIVRAFKILLRAGALPEMPDIIREEGLDIEIVFVNQLARSQQAQDVATITQFAQQVGGFAQIDPQAIDNIDVDGAIRHIANVLGVPEEAVASEDAIAQKRQQRAQQAQQQQALQGASVAADAASKVGVSAGG